ncbi:GNAT family N-acetyltransferase [Marinomonas balearica]|uniref:Ribosomal-protein-alanine N-acetyltransferase n=1 Tax=Marinomonas balearica TaxID=491947 RepID=A0A4R6M2V8_9GAMM|nr:GNAT family N-acetyltransferase [Marinomonas balearica]TDO95514.1 ribosomal-protein-alanine N-acetyltransferase [Marinomonas balearica]
MSYSIRTAKISDLVAIVDLNNSSNPYPWSERLIEESLNARTSWVLQSDSARPDALTAWLVASNVCGQSELELILVAKDERRKGYAEALLLAWRNWADELKHDELLLEVRESNVAAIELYYKIGFEEVGRRKNYYTHSSGKEAACLMSLFLK